MLNKINFLLLLWLGITQLSMAQQKPEFGFVGKLGTYAFPKQKTIAFLQYEQNRFTESIHFTPGRAYALGIWQSLPLDNHFQLLGELYFSHSVFTSIHHYDSDYYDGGILISSRAVNKQMMTENSLSLPIKLQYNFKKKSKLSVSLGAGISHVFSQGAVDKERSDNGPDEIRVASPVHYTETAYSKFLNAGVYYRMNPKTFVGLEFSTDKSGVAGSPYPDAYLRCDCLCECYNLPYLTKPNRNSFSVSLRHNILDKKP